MQHKKIHPLPMASKDTDLIKLLVLCGGFFILAFVIADFAHASVGQGGGMPYEGALGNIRKSATGPIAYTASLVGIVVSGWQLIFGQDIGRFMQGMMLLVMIISVLVAAENFMASNMGAGSMLATYVVTAFA